MDLTWKNFILPFGIPETWSKGNLIFFPFRIDDFPSHCLFVSVTSLCPLLVWYCLHLCPVPNPFWPFCLHSVAFQSGLFFSSVLCRFSFNILSPFLVITWISKVKEFSSKCFQHISPQYPLPKSTCQIPYFFHFLLFWHTTTSQNEVGFRIDPRCLFDKITKFSLCFATNIFDFLCRRPVTDTLILWI